MSVVIAQTFTIASRAVGGSGSADVAAVDLYYRARPSANGAQNSSGIDNPSTVIALAPCVNSVPDLSRIAPLSVTRVPYWGVAPTSDCSIPTRYAFATPVPVDTDAEYALLAHFDDPDFELWSATVGDVLASGSGVASGPLGPYVGHFYEGLSAPPSVVTASNLVVSNSSLIAVGAPGASLAPDFAEAGWRPTRDTDLRFTVYVARYGFSGDANLSAYVGNGIANSSMIVTGSSNAVQTGSTWEMDVPSARLELATFSSTLSDFAGMAVSERVFQMGPYWPSDKSPVTLSVSNTSNVVTASSNQSFTTVFAPGGSDPEWVVMIGLNQYGANATGYSPRRVTAVVNNSALQLDAPPAFTNSAAYFRRSPVAYLQQLSSAKIFGVSTALAVLVDSTANSTVRFVSDAIRDVSVSAGGTGYSNSDFVTVTGYSYSAGKDLQGYSANVVLITNSTGGVTSAYLVNAGSGFANSSNLTWTFSNSTGGASAGSGATLAANVGTRLVSEWSGQRGSGQLERVRLVDLDVGSETPTLVVDNPTGTAFEASQRLAYYSVDDSSVYGGRVTYCDADSARDVFVVKSGQSWVGSQELTKRRTIPSFSREWMIPYANGTACQARGGSTSGSYTGGTNSSVLELTWVSNSDFTDARLAAAGSSWLYSRPIVNGDATNEELPASGNAWARGIEVPVSLANDNFAQDLRVYATVWQPPGTNVVAYAKLHNSADVADGVSAKYWTKLRLVSGANLYSSAVDPTATIELTWALPSYPAGTVLAGTATTVNGSANLVGAGTSWSTNATINVAAGDVVLVQRALFPDDYLVSVVTAVANDASITIADAVANDDVIGSGMIVSKVTWPHAAFLNFLSGNVARYYDSSMTARDSFDTVQVKLVLLSDDGLTSPRADDVRAVAVSS